VSNQTILFVDNDQLGIMKTVIATALNEPLKKRRQSAYRNITVALRAMGLISNQAEIKLLGSAIKSTGEVGLLVVFEVPINVAGQVGPTGDNKNA